MQPLTVAHARRWYPIVETHRVSLQKFQRRRTKASRPYPGTVVFLGSPEVLQAIPGRNPLQRYHGFERAGLGENEPRAISVFRAILGIHQFIQIQYPA